MILEYWVLTLIEHLRRTNRLWWMARNSLLTGKGRGVIVLDIDIDRQFMLRYLSYDEAVVALPDLDAERKKPLFKTMREYNPQHFAVIFSIVALGNDQFEVTTNLVRFDQPTYDDSQPIDINQPLTPDPN